MKQTSAQETILDKDIEVYERRLKGEISRLPYSFWTDTNMIKKILKYLLEKKLQYTDEQVLEVFSVKFIQKYKLWGVMVYFNGSPFALLDSVYPGKYKEWELKNVPINTWDMDTAVKAMKWLIKKKLKWKRKDVCQKLCKKTFTDNGFYGLLHFLGDSPYKAINTAYPGKYKEWEFKHIPLSTWTIEKQVEAIRWLFEEKLKWSKADMLLYADKSIFSENGLSRIIRIYGGNVYKVINIAYPGEYEPEDLKHLREKV